jgi:hypothetical protein
MIKRVESCWAEELKAQEKTRAAPKAKKAVAVAKGKALAITDHVLQPSNQTLTLLGKNPLHIYRLDWLDQRRARGIRTPRLFSMWDDIKRDFGALTADQRTQYEERSAKDMKDARHNRSVAAAAVSSAAVFMSKAVAKGEAEAARTLRRFREGDRKDRELLLPFKGSIWKPVPAGETLAGALARIFLPVPVEPGAPRRVYIRRGVELRKYGFTEGCPGCVVAQAVTMPAQNHSEQCRNRIGEAMKRDRDDTVMVEESDRRRHKMTKVKNEPVVARVYLRRRVELKKYGFTRGCLGCVWAQSCTVSAQSHSEQCRNRIVQLMKRDRDGAVRVEMAQKMMDLKKERAGFTTNVDGHGRASSSSAGLVAASTLTSSAAAGPTLDAEMGDSVDIDDC